MEAKKTLLVNKLAQLTEINKELMKKNTQLDKERKDKVARLTSENTKLKEWVTKLDKDFASKLSTTQLLSPVSIIRHAQHGLMLEYSRAQNAKAHLEALMKEKDHLVSRCKAMEEGIKPVLDLIGMEPEVGPTDRQALPEAIIEKCQSSWACFKQYIRDAGEYVVAHVLAVVRSHYPGVDLKHLEAGMSSNTDPAKVEHLRATS
jgi:hypothetical protein